MSWFSKIKRTKAPAAAPNPDGDEISLEAVAGYMIAVLAPLEKGAPDLALLCARLGDLQRDVEVDPCDPEQFMSEANTLDIETQRRLALALSGFDEVKLRRAYSLPGNGEPAERVGRLFGFAREHDLLTIEIMLESPLRREEFIRYLIHHLGAKVLGETPEASRERLKRLDYKNLLSEAERAKMSAVERLAYLKKLQEEQEKRLGRRGKI